MNYTCRGIMVFKDKPELSEIMNNYFSEYSKKIFKFDGKPKALHISIANPE